MLCQDIFDNCLSMAVLNDIIDYDVFEDSITDKLFGGVAVDEKYCGTKICVMYDADQQYWEMITHDDGVDARGDHGSNLRRNGIG